MGGTEVRSQGQEEWGLIQIVSGVHPVEGHVYTTTGTRAPVLGLCQVGVPETRPASQSTLPVGGIP